MKEKETEFTIKIKTYSKSTIEKITNLMTSIERFYIIRGIVISSKTEQEVVEKLDIISQVNEKEFTQKLMTFSKTTLQKIAKIANSEKVLPKIYQIVMGNKTEQEIIKELEKL